MVVEWNLGGGWVGLGSIFGDFWTAPYVVLAFAKKATVSEEILVPENLGQVFLLSFFYRDRSLEYQPAK